jgi:hypothetical protein
LRRISSPRPTRSRSGNELDAIQLCHGYVEAQGDYAEMKRTDGSVAQYAQRIVSTPGKQDGLAWKNADGTWGGPIGENIANLIEQGYAKGDAYHGYYFKVLKGQGPAAPMGRMDYVVKGVMIGGFALAATPAEYRVTGVKTFIVSNDGVVYEKDLGTEHARRIQEDGTLQPRQDLEAGHGTVRGLSDSVDRSSREQSTSAEAARVEQPENVA